RRRRSVSRGAISRPSQDELDRPPALVTSPLLSHAGDARHDDGGSYAASARAEAGARAAEKPFRSTGRGVAGSSCDRDNAGAARSCDARDALRHRPEGVRAGGTQARAGELRHGCGPGARKGQQGADRLPRRGSDRLAQALSRIGPRRAPRRREERRGFRHRAARAAVAPGVLAAHQALCAQGGDRVGGPVAPYATACLRHTPSQSRRRPARGAAPARSFGHHDHDHLYARRARATETAAREASPTRLKAGIAGEEETMDSSVERSQLRVNVLAIVSLVIALIALGYTTWRNERTEYNRNVRVAAFETLKQLGEAQIIVEYAHFQKNRQLGDPLQGWGRMIYIRDLAKLLPASAPADAERLWVAWRDNIEKLEDDKEALVKITDEMQLLRLSVLD